MNPSPVSPERAADMRRRLLSHYDRSRRDLPWRGETDPYRILVSEVMLQQTRADTVKRYYGSWLKRFPDPLVLAAADIADVLKAWEGLGYYRRARNLHAAARVVREHFGGSVPSGYENLRVLPGVGEYTAGAVASIAFDEHVPAVDGNVRRVLSRVFDVADPKAAWLREVALSLVDPARPGDWNQALMELGATVCRPRRPRCGECPIGGLCTARRAGTQAERPASRSRKEVRHVRFALAVLRSGRQVMLTQRPAEALLGGLWAFPEAEITGDAHITEGVGRDAVLRLASGLGVAHIGEPERLPAVEHRFTHLAATYVPWHLPVEYTPARSGVEWVDPDQPTELAIPVAQQKVLQWVRDRPLTRVVPGLRGS